MIKVILLPVKLLALPVMLVLLVLSLLGKAATTLSAYVIGLFLVVLIGIDLYCLWQHRWTDVAIVTVLGRCHANTPVRSNARLRVCRRMEPCAQKIHLLITRYTHFPICCWSRWGFFEHYHLKEVCLWQQQD